MNDLRCSFLFVIGLVFGAAVGQLALLAVAGLR